MHNAGGELPRTILLRSSVNRERETLFGGTIRIMNSAIAGLIGVVIGAVVSVAGTFITPYLQIRAQQQQAALQRSTEREQALRIKREEAYKETLQHLIRVRDRRMSDLKRYGTTGQNQNSEPQALNRGATQMTSG